MRNLDQADLQQADRQQQLADTRQRLTRLEAETHRLRAQLARLEAAGEDEAAARLEAQLAEYAVETTSARLLINQTSETLSEVQSHKRSPTLGEELIAAQPLPGFSLSPRQATVQRPASTGKGAATPGETTGKEKRSASKSPPSKQRSLTERLRRAPAWAASLGLHVGLILLCSLVTFASLNESSMLLLASAVDGEEDYFDEFVAMDLTPVELETTDLELLELDPVEWTESSLSEIESPLEDSAQGFSELSPGLAAALLTDMPAMAAGNAGGSDQAAGSASGRQDAGSHEPGATQFFGSKSRGERFVFLIDNSGSMQQGRLETTLLELQKAVGAMSAQQSFYVVFFSDQAYPMFYPQAVEEMQPATRDNKRRLNNWLASVEMCVGGRLMDAMEMAVKLEPNVVYLLSDGEIGSTRTMNYLTETNDWPFVIHTLGMTVRNAEAADKLAAIARSHGGGFRPVGINPAAVRMSRLRPVPYHNRGPGPVWGSQVRPR